MKNKQKTYNMKPESNFTIYIVLAIFTLAISIPLALLHFPFKYLIITYCCIYQFYFFLSFKKEKIFKRVLNILEGKVVGARQTDTMSKKMEGVAFGLFSEILIDYYHESKIPYLLNMAIALSMVLISIFNVVNNSFVNHMIIASILVFSCLTIAYYLYKSSIFVLRFRKMNENVEINFVD